jgi:hypothetical protein
VLIPRKTPRDVDAIARNLATLGLQAANLPPAFMGAGIKEPVFAPAGIGLSSPGVIGHVLDGKGLYVDFDLKKLGINKPIPHVYERTPFMRLKELLLDDAAAITTYDGIIAARGAGNYYDPLWGKISYTTVANTWSSLYRATGTPGAGTYSATPGAKKDATDAAALSLGVPAPGSNTQYLISFGAQAAQQINWFQLVDLLVCVGTISVTSTSAQTVSSAALTRYTTGAGVYMTFEVTTALGSTAGNITVSYTNQANTSGQSSGAQAMTTSAIVQRLLPITIGYACPLASGDYGVRAVASTTMSAANSAGVIALNIFKPLAFLPGLSANVYGEKDTSITVDGLVPLPLDSGSNQVGCLALYALTNTTSTGICNIGLRTVQG